MSKNHRGKGITMLPSHGRGVCPICHRTAIKVIYDLKKDDVTLKVCKVCHKIASR
jgi:hypothetical protein